MIEKSKQFKRFLSTAPGKVLLSAIVFVILIASTITVYAVGGNDFVATVLDGDKTITVHSDSAEPYDILAKAGVTLGEGDEIDASAFDAQDRCVISVKRFINVVIEESGKSVQKSLAARTVADVLESGEYNITSKDEVSPEKDSVAVDGMKIVIKRCPRVIVTADGKEYHALADGQTVAQILEENGIILGKDDEVSPSPDKVIKSDTKISVMRVTYKQETKTETLKYKTVKKQVTSLAAGKTKIVKTGANGKQEVTYKVKYVDGKRTSQKAVARKVIEKATDRVVNVGRKPASYSSSYTANEVSKGYFIDSAGKKVAYRRSYTGQSTAYTASETGSNRTASGMTAAVGRVAVDPRKIPYGTKLYITGYGYCVAADTGGFVYNSSTIVDLYMNTYSECISWGRRTVTMYVLA